MLSSIPAIVPRKLDCPSGSRASSAGLLLGNRRLGGGQAGDGHTVRRTTDVIEPDLMAEDHAGRVAAMLAANPDLELFTGLPSPCHADPHQPPDPVLVDRLERIAADHV